MKALSGTTEQQASARRWVPVNSAATMERRSFDPIMRTIEPFLGFIQIHIPASPYRPSERWARDRRVGDILSIRGRPVAVSKMFVVPVERSLQRNIATFQIMHLTDQLTASPWLWPSSLYSKDLAIARMNLPRQAIIGICTRRQQVRALFEPYEAQARWIALIASSNESTAEQKVCNRERSSLSRYPVDPRSTDPCNYLGTDVINELFSRKPTRASAK